MLLLLAFFINLTHFVRYSIIFYSKLRKNESKKCSICLPISSAFMNSFFAFFIIITYCSILMCRLFEKVNSSSRVRCNKKLRKPTGLPEHYVSLLSIRDLPNAYEKYDSWNLTWWCYRGWHICIISSIDIIYYDIIDTNVEMLSNAVVKYRPMEVKTL